MTRFARAKGSKASNERVFHEPTPWHQMKNSMLKKSEDFEEEKKRREIEAKRSENYQKFLKEREEETLNKTEWAEFPENNIPKVNGLSAKSKKIKKNKDKNVDNQLKKKAVLALKEETTVENTKTVANLKRNGLSLNSEVGNEIITVSNEKPKKKKLKIISESENNNENEDEGPVETSAKIQIPEVVNKAKLKKKKVKITNIEQTKTENVATSKKEKKKAVNNECEKAKKEKKPVDQKKEIDLDTLSEADRNKILKKQEKRRKQIEKKKLKKQQIQEEKEKSVAENPNNQNEKPKIFEKKQINKSAEKFNNSKPLNQGPVEKTPKKQKFENGDFKRKKDFLPNKIMVNGNEVELEYIDGFPIKKEDAKIINRLKKEMISKGLPRSEINRTLKLERRKAEKALAREKKKVCFNCRKFGHNLSECPMLSSKDELVDTAGAGICFKCGSTEHTSFVCRVEKGQNFKFATCFICKEQGHISRQCPDNARGLYPKGGSCRVCGDVTHLKRDCPQFQDQQKKEEAKFYVDTIHDGNPDDFGPRKDLPKSTESSTKPKIIKF